MYATIRTACAGIAVALAIPVLAAAQAVVIEPGLLKVGPAGTELTGFDLEALDALPQIDFETGTIWTDGTSRFSGVPVAELLDAAGIDPEAYGPEAMLELVALNDYRVRIPLDTIEPEVPIVATRVDDETVSIRDKGPYWLVYPYDRDAAYRTEDIYKRSIWQLTQMIVSE